MSFVKVASVALASVLGGALLASAQTPVSVSLDEAACLKADEYWELTASFIPEPQKAQLFFKSALGKDFYYVEMTKGPNGWFARLPKIQKEAGTVTYYAQATAADLGTGRSADVTANVISGAESCDGKLAAIAASGPAAGLPASGLAAAAAAAGGAVAAGAAGATLGTGAIIAGGVVAAGVAGAVVVNNNDGNASPSR